MAKQRPPLSPPSLSIIHPVKTFLPPPYLARSTSLFNPFSAHISVSVSPFPSFSPSHFFSAHIYLPSPPPSSPPLRFHFYNCCRAFHSRNTSEACQQGIMFLTMHCYRWGGHGHRRCGQRRCLALASPRHRRRRRFPEYYRVHTCVRKKKHPAIIHPPDRPRFRFHPPFIR